LWEIFKRRVSRIDMLRAVNISYKNPHSVWNSLMVLYSTMCFFTIHRDKKDEHLKTTHVPKHCCHYTINESLCSNRSTCTCALETCPLTFSESQDKYTMKNSPYRISLDNKKLVSINCMTFQQSFNSSACFSLFFLIPLANSLNELFSFHLMSLR
jgi:hypothetical protein